MNQTAYPLLPEIGVIALVPDQWGDMWQTRQNVLTRLARYFRVLWMNPAREWQEVLSGPLVYNSLGHNLSLPESFIVHNPQPWLPKLYRPEWLARLFLRQRLNYGRRKLIRAGCKKIILYLWRAEFANALAAIPSDLKCYHIDDEYSFSDIDAPVDELESRLIRSVDQVFIHSPGLYEKKGNINAHTMLVPNGVDYETYARPLAQPADLAHIARPRIGYTGWIKKQLDWLLLDYLTQKHPDWSFVFVGGQNPHPEITSEVRKLSERRNVQFLGRKSSLELASYPQHFDVSIMPYLANDYTKYIYPLKLHEYLASGCPVVGTRIRSLEDFETLVSLASNPDEWSSAISQALRPAANTAERRAARQAVAWEHDWDVLVAKVVRTMAGRLGQEFIDRLPVSPIERWSGEPLQSGVFLG